jgi:hypothetical protein
MVLVFVDAGECWLPTAASSGSDIPVFSHYVTVLQHMNPAYPVLMTVEIEVPKMFKYKIYTKCLQIHVTRTCASRGHTVLYIYTQSKLTSSSVNYSEYQS